MDLKPFNCPECRQDHIMPSSSSVSQPTPETANNNDDGGDPNAVNFSSTAEEASDLPSSEVLANVAGTNEAILSQNEGDAFIGNLHIPIAEVSHTEVDVYNSDNNNNVNNDLGHCEDISHSLSDLHNHGSNSNSSNNLTIEDSNIIISSNNDLKKNRVSFSTMDNLCNSLESSHITLHQFPLFTEADEFYEIPSMAFVSMGKAIAESDFGYDFLSDTSSEPHHHHYKAGAINSSSSNNNNSPIKSPSRAMFLQKKLKSHPPKLEESVQHQQVNQKSSTHHSTTTTTPVWEEIEVEDDYVNLESVLSGQRWK